jgi:arsenite/tail-anchored protein-transporting ATPase
MNQTANASKPNRRPTFLDSRSLRLLLFGGKGGVGKTTCASATALCLAAERPDQSFLLVSTDPAHSVQDSLAGMLPPANLAVLELDAQQCLEDFRRESGDKLHAIAAAGTFLDDEDISRFLSLSLPGLDELMAFLKIVDWVEKRAYASIVVDTAPSGHTLRLLAMPGLIRKWLSMLDALLAKRRYMRKVFSRSSRPDELDTFLTGWWTSVRSMERLLRDRKRCQFVPVSLAEPLSISETTVLKDELQRWHIPVENLMINQLHSGAGCCPTCSSAQAREREQVGRLRSSLSGAELWGVDVFAEEIRGAELLTHFWEQVRPLEPMFEAASAAIPDLDGFRTAHAPAVEMPAEAFSPQVQLVLFTGKGGVGKTTLSCATALRLARDFPEKRILLFSTDPAHSLSACLGQEIGPQPVPVVAGLSAVEIDAHTEFEALKAQYAGDIQDFLGSVAAGFDLTFDRVVMERMMDLAPPGVDEMMALTRILDLLIHRRYDLFVLDSAATGHFIRLIEMPALMDQWLKTFFSVLLKYERVLKLPRFCAQLVELSKNLKQFRALLGDRDRTVLYVVSIPARMAWEETQDLLAACDRLGLHVPALFLNRLTPPGDCRLCTSLRSRECIEAENFRQAFPRQQQVLVYQQSQPPVGRERLEELAQALYQAPCLDLVGAGGSR